MAFDLSDRIDAMVRIDPDAPALNAADHWRPWSYLSRAVDELDALLTAHAVGRHARVGIVMRNRPEVVRALVAMLATRRCVVTLSPMAPREVLRDELGRLGLSAMLVCEQDWGSDELATVVAAAGGLAVEVLDHPEDQRDVIGRVAVPSAPARLTSTAPGVAVQMLTSGTTGPVRRTDITYDALVREFESTSRPGPSSELAEARLRSGTAVTWAPMVHIGGLRAVLAAVIAGRRLAMLEKFEIEAWQRLVTEHRPRVISLVPTALRMVYEGQVPRATFDSVQVVMCGTAPVSPELVDAFEERYGVSVLTMYGATEFGGVAGWTLSDRMQYRTSKRGSVGRANSGVSVRVVDPGSGAPVEPGQDGVLEVTGGQVGAGAWLRTTDRAKLDHDGFLWILGRVDDVIIRGGFKVSLTEVRDALLTHPAVRDAVVIAVPDERLGQVPVSVVEAQPGQTSATDLAEHLARRLSRYQLPVQIRVVERLPRTPSMKPDGAAVRALLDGSEATIPVPRMERPMTAVPTPIPTLEELRASVGRTFGPTDWFEITQARIDAFADATGDHNWIHVDPERSQRGPYGTTIAHGHLTSSLAPMFLSQLMTIGFGRRLNYGSDKVRFPEPVPCGSRIRARATITDLDERPSGILLRTEIVVEIEGKQRPACVAESLRFIAS